MATRQSQAKLNSDLNQMKGLFLVLFLLLPCFSLTQDSVDELKERIKVLESQLDKYINPPKNKGFKADYISKIKLYDVNILEDENTISFKLQNKGDRTLNAVQVVFYFKDKNNNIIFEQEAYPVLVLKDMGISLGGESPLKPNYITKYEFPIIAPSEWVGKIEYKIQDIRFAR